MIKAGNPYWREGISTVDLLVLSGSIGLYHPPDGITNHKYKLLHFLTTKYFLQWQEDINF
jgi:hypothetical protein